MDRHSQEVDDLIRQYRNGAISRREFFRLGLAVGGAAIYAALPTSAPATVALAAPQKAAAPKRTDATIVLEERIESLDPHDHNGLTAHLLFKNIYDGLVDRNPVGRIVPALATEWKVIQPTVWEF